MDKDPFKEYLKQTEPKKREKGYAWHTAMGLQAVDGLQPSQYLIDTAIQNIEGDITIDEAQALLESYYKEKPVTSVDKRTEEADKVSVRIARILSENAFTFTPNEYISIHRRLFTGIYGYAGQIRDYNITKNEWVLDGDTVIYGSALELRATLEYDFSQEKNFSYEGLSMEGIIHHLSVFISRLWQIHIFGEGNTRTTAVFFIKYLRSLGFKATNDIFAENAWYFRNALVRANYNNFTNGVHETTKYLEMFLENLLCGGNHRLRNRDLHVNTSYIDYVKEDFQTKKRNNIIEEERVQTLKQDIQIEKKNIPAQKQDIRTEKQDIDFEKIFGGTSRKTIYHFKTIYKIVGRKNVFGRSHVQDIIGLSPSRASKLLKMLLDANVIKPVFGHGKGRYIFDPSKEE